MMRVLVQEAGAVPSEQRDVVRARKDRYFAMGRDLVRAVIERGSARDGVRSKPRVDDAELERATYAFFGMMNWMHAWYDPRRHGDASDVAHTIHRIAIAGLVGTAPLEVSEASAARGAR